MISETTLVSCRNVPPEMSARFDEPWIFTGEVKAYRPYEQCVCRKCSVQPSIVLSLSPSYSPMLHIVDMKGYLFITDDMIECIVYFGVCNNCDSVYWARQGPPFKRARCLVPS